MNRRHYDFETLLRIMARLRDPERGCAWDLQQDFTSLLPHTLSEAEELAEAVRDGDDRAICDELGDLLLQVIFYAQIATDQRRFSFADVVQTLAEKLLRRHPHVFPDGDPDGEAADTVRLSAEEVARRWEEIKAEERRVAAAQRQSGAKPEGGNARSLPAGEVPAEPPPHSPEETDDSADRADSSPLR